MKRGLLISITGLIALSVGGSQADGRGFGGFRFGGSFGGGGYRESSFSGSRSESWGRSGLDSFGGSRESSFSGSRSESYGGWSHSGEFSGSRSGNFEAGSGRASGSGSYDRSYTGSRGGSYNASGKRGFAAGPEGVSGSSSRDVNATGPAGRSYASSSQRGYAVGPYGRTVGGNSGSATVLRRPWHRVGKLADRVRQAGPLLDRPRPVALLVAGRRDHVPLGPLDELLVAQLRHRPRRDNPGQLRLLRCVPPGLVHGPPGLLDGGRVGGRGRLDGGHLGRP